MKEAQRQHEAIRQVSTATATSATSATAPAAMAAKAAAHDAVEKVAQQQGGRDRFNTVRCDAVAATGADGARGRRWSARRSIAWSRRK